METSERGCQAVLAFPFHDWHKALAEGFRTRDAHLLREIARRPGVGPVVVIDRPVSRLEHLLRKRAYRVPGTVLWEGTRGPYCCWVTRVEKNILVIDTQTPDLVAPARHGRGWWFDVFARAAVVGLLRDAIAAAGASSSPTIAWLPTVAPVIEEVRPSRFVFDSLDNWLIHPTLQPFQARATDGYARLLPSANAVFVAAPRSARVLERWRSDIAILPNGVDESEFRRPRPRPIDLPDGVIVGYAGKLADRIDVDLVVSVAASMPQVSFVFVGQVLRERAIRPIRRVRNTLLLGDRHYTLLPAYLQHFDVAWIPHRVGAMESGGDPIKLYEYWAAGRPVVSTRIDGLERYADFLPLVTTPQEAVSALESALRRPLVPPLPPGRTWSAIADRILDELVPRAVR